MRKFLFVIMLFLAPLAYGQDDGEDHGALASSKSAKLYSENGRMGLQKNERKYITPAIYDTLIAISDGLYAGQRFSSNRQHNLWGIINKDGEVVLPFRYRTLQFKFGFLVAGYSNNNRLFYGVFSIDGSELVYPKYEIIKIHNNQVIEARKAGITILISNTGQKLGEFEADSVSLLDDYNVKLYRQGKAGLSGLDNKQIVPADYKEIRINNNNIYVLQYPKWRFIRNTDTLEFNLNHVTVWNDIFISMTSGKSHLMDKSQRAISRSYEKIIPVTNGFALVEQDGLWGAINVHGKEILPLIYEKILANSEFAAAKSCSKIPKWTIFDLYGYHKTPLVYDSVKMIADGRIPIKRNSKWGYLDRYGVEIISPIFDSASEFKEGKAIVDFFGQTGLIDREGKWLVIPQENEIVDFNKKIILCLAEEQYQMRAYDGSLIYFSGNTLSIGDDGIIEHDSSNKFLRKISWEGTILSDIYSGESVRAGGSGLTIFKENGKYGFKNQPGQIIIANRYEDVKPFHQGFAAVKLNNHWGFINIDERLVVQPRYDSVGHFTDGICITKSSTGLGVINEQGDEIIANEYQSIIKLTNGNFRVQKTGHWGVLNEDGSILIHPKYDELTPTGQGYYIVRRRNSYGTIDSRGVNQIPIMYDYIAYDQKSHTQIIKESYNEEWALLRKAHPAIAN